ncbi:hypothetical protein VB713_20345 [Anabaena cylindrica UHCC 0172]|uniref:hypothetical protein n=1 Tax=Anabaena cylindrica TaxID=1165 RepID=UPI002B1FA13D|nr:hypothetical protein [Anabaena cylindrica]MEA5553293.1 hypothetical protein [Anabaena cylindrica UHCC 0172]
MEYNIGAIRKLVEKALVLEEFNNLVFDNFNYVYNQFTNGQEQSERIRLLVNYANKHMEIDKLLEKIKQINLQVFNEFESCIFEHNTPTVITTETGLKLLRSLNYSTDESYFKELIKLKEVAFLIQAPNVRVQNWLIERLIYHVPNSINARKNLIDFQSYAVSSSIENFWHEFKDISTEENPNFTSIVDDLANLCQTKTIIIIMRKLNFLDQETIDKIFDFWHNLVNKVRSRKGSKIQSRLVLLLIAEPTEYSNKFCSQEQKFNFIKPNLNRIKQKLIKNTEPKDIFLLSPMDKLPPKDVQEWLQKNEVLSSLKFNEQNHIDKLLNNVIPCWGEVPENVIYNICENIFNFTNGIAEIETMWKY